MERTDQRRYKIQEVLGKGGFGTVYRAQLLGSGGFRKDVALKVLNDDMASNPDVVRRLRDEARMLGLLRHRSIVNVDSLAMLAGRWTIVMEYVDGSSLRDLVSLGPMPPSAALETTEEVAAALNVAFSTVGDEGKPLGLLHRDIKPGNVQITARGEVKLLDFGVAKADFGDREAHTRSLIFGSINYLAPERLDFEDTHKGDIYALGCTLFEMLTADRLDKASINPRKHAAKVEATRARIMEVHGDPDLADLVASTLAYEPNERPDARTLERKARAIRRGYPEPWLRDWAEKQVPQAQAHRSRQDDDWSGSMVDESGSIGNETMALGQDEVVPEQRAVPIAPAAPPSQPASPPRAPEPPAAPRSPRAAPATAKAPPRPPPRKRRAARPKKRKSRVGRWILGISLTLLLLLVLVPGILVLATGGGLYALVVGTGAWDETIREDIGELEVVVQGTAPNPHRDELITLLQQAQAPGSGNTIGFMELVGFEQLVERISKDGTIDEVDLANAKQRWAEISAN